MCEECVVKGNMDLSYDTLILSDHSRDINSRRLSYICVLSGHLTLMQLLNFIIVINFKIEFNHFVDDFLPDIINPGD